MNLSPTMRATLAFIERNGGHQPLSEVGIPTTRALERRGLAQCHSGGAYIGELGVFLTDEGRKAARKCQREGLSK